MKVEMWPFQFHDKMALKQTTKRSGEAHAIARYGSFLGKEWS